MLGIRNPTKHELYAAVGNCKKRAYLWKNHRDDSRQIGKSRGVEKSCGPG